ncbi:helix-turn-helix transcriptional regulator [Maioricimonas sp. JC845]|uniref:helix-turn-helix transcriptional regulator n=1 Tax=Maioricimonas sp. JC845 TaxID=3232138 RepID=UPI00345AB6DE
MSSLAEALWAWRVRFRVDVLAAGTHPLLEGQQASLPHIFVVPDRIARIQVQVGGQSLDVREGEAFVVARPQAYPIAVQPEPDRTEANVEPAEAHGQAETAPWCPAHPDALLIRLSLREDVPAQLLAGCPAVVTCPTSADRVRLLSRLVADEVARLPDMCRTTMAHLGNLLLLTLLEPLQESVSGAESSGIVPVEVSTSVQLMRDDLARRWTVASLAEEVGMSRSAFASLFSEVVGKTPMTVLLDYRMQRAGDLLARSRSSIKEIAAEVGYRSSATFSTVFRKWSGLSPTEFRRSHS